MARRTSVSWADFKRSRPDLAGRGAELIKRHGVGLGFIATVRPDGGPRVHPCCPAITDTGLYVFVVDRSPKYRDLLRDPRYALHAFPADQDEEFYVAGAAARIDDASVWEAVVATHHYRPREDERLFELRIDRALHTTWTNWAQPDTKPNYTRWRP